MIVVGDVLIERDAATGASYYVLDEVDVGQTVEVDELVSVDLAADGHPVGVEFAFSRVPTHDDWLPVLNAYPDLKESLALRT